MHMRQKGVEELEEEVLEEEEEEGAMDVLVVEAGPMHPRVVSPFVQCTISQCLVSHPTLLRIQEESFTSVQMKRRETPVCHSNGLMNLMAMQRQWHFIQAEHLREAEDAADVAEGEEGDSTDHGGVIYGHFSVTCCYTNGRQCLITTMRSRHNNKVNSIHIQGS